MLHRLRQIGSFVLHYNVFISLCAAAMTYETGVISGHMLPNWPLLFFQFFATLFAYNFYYIKSRFHPWSTAISLASVPPALISFWFMDCPSYLTLSMICLCALLYTLPGLAGLRYTPQIKLGRLFLLSLTWTLATFSLPLKGLNENLSWLPFGIYRFLLLWNLCLLFFMRDELHYFNAQRIHRTLVAGLLLQGMLAVLITYHLSTSIGLAYLAAGVLQNVLSFRITRRPHPDKDYLLYVDGIMPAQTIFVIIMHFWHTF